MKHYYISHMEEKTKQKHIALYNKIKRNGECIGCDWDGDYLVATYKYKNKFYELWENMELGIISEVVERSI